MARILASGTLAALALCATQALAQAPRGEALICERTGFEGNSASMRGDTTNFAYLGFNDRAASLTVLDGTWEFCTDTYYRGSCRIYERGEYRNLGDAKLRVASARLVAAPPEGWATSNALRPGPDRWTDVGQGEVSLFEGADLSGFLATLNEPAPDFARIGIDERVASVIVERGIWEFCVDAQFRGACRLIGPGEARSLPSGKDGFSSARPVVGGGLFGPAKVSP